MADVSPSTLPDELTTLPADEAEITFVVDDTNAGENKTKKVNQSFLKTLFGATTITPQMYGFVDDFDGTTGTDNAAAVQAAADACDALNAAASNATVYPTLYFPKSEGYYCESTITVKERIHVTMDSPIVHNDSESSVGIIIGTTDVVSKHVVLKLRVTRRLGDTSDWTNEGSIGAKLINLNSSQVWIEVGSLAGGFTIGCQLMGSGTGFAVTTVNAGQMRDNKIDLDFNNETATGIGWCNANTVIGGWYVADSGLRSGIERYAFRFKSNDGTNKSINQNMIVNPTIEKQSECIPVLVVNGQLNEITGARDEGNSGVFAKVLHDSSFANKNNVFRVGWGSGTLVQEGNAINNDISYRTQSSTDRPLRLVFDSGPLNENATAYDGTKTFIPAVHTSVRTDSESTIAATDIDFVAEETFTTDFATDNDKLLDTAHARQSGDRVYLTTSAADLPSGLAENTLYYVVSPGTDDFKLATTLNGTPVTFSDDGSGTHTYHSRNRYIAMTSQRAVGIFVDTSEVKNFVVERDADAGFGGRLAIIAYDANGIQLKDADTFTVDDPNNEFIQADHTLVVDDVITLTTTGTLPGTLATATDYYVISIDDTSSGRFRVSLTKGGSAVTDLSGGSGVHTYTMTDSYVEFGNYWNTAARGGAYYQSADGSGDRNVKIRDEVKYVDMLLNGHTEDIRLRRFKIYTRETSGAPRTWTAYDGQPGQSLVSQAPTWGVYFAPMTVWDDTPAAAAPPGWVLVTSGAPGTWKAMANLAS